MTCKTHPGVPARRKCFFCKSSICTECQKKSHHHIFCSDACILAFEEKYEDQKTNKFFNRLDQSISDDFKEHSSDILERLDVTLTEKLSETRNWNEEKHTYLEDLIQKLTQQVQTQKIFIQQWFDERSHDIERFNKIIAIANKKNKKLGLKIASKTSEGQEEVRQKLSEHFAHLESTKATLIQEMSTLETETQSRLEKFQKTMELTVEASSKNFNDIFSKQEVSRAQDQARIDRLIKLGYKKNKHLHRQHQTRISQVQAELQEKMSEQGAAFEKTRTHFIDEMAALKTATNENLTQFKKSIQTSYDSSSKELLDNISSLLAAQKGNWQEIIDASQKGSKDAALTLREALRHELRGQMIELAKIEAQSLKKASQEAKSLLVNSVNSQLSPWPRRASMAAITLSFITLLILPLMFINIKDQNSALLNLEKTHVIDKKQEVIVKAPAVVEAQKNEPTLHKPLPTISNLDRGSLMRKELAFTFDGGSNNRAAEKILDILKENKIKSTMFLTGQFIDDNPKVAQRILHDGHEAGNHLYRHEHLVNPATEASHYTKEQLIKEMQDVEKAFLNATGKPMSKLWRAPFGEVTQEQIEWAKSKGYVHVGWTRNRKATLDLHDWVADPKHRLFKTPAQIADKVLAFEKSDPNGLNGAIVLMHLGSDRTENQMAHLALPKLFEELKTRGYRMLPITDILRTEVAQND